MREVGSQFQEVLCTPMGNECNLIKTHRWCFVLNNIFFDEKLLENDFAAGTGATSNSGQFANETNWNPYFKISEMNYSP